MYCPLKFGRGWEVIDKTPDLAVCETQDCAWWNPEAYHCAMLIGGGTLFTIASRLDTIADHLQEISQAKVWGL